MDSEIHFQTIAYRIRDSLYLNITNRCTNACRFCPKFKDFIVKGYYLKLKKEPSYEEIIDAIDKAQLGYNEVVFCGYGEPLLRLDTVIKVATYLKKRGLKVRINTDGLANLVYGENILPKLKGLVDSISISLNSSNAEQYSKLCPSKYGLKAYPALVEFIKEAKKFIPEVTVTVVDLPEVDVKECEKIANELSVNFRKREYNKVG